MRKFFTTSSDKAPNDSIKPEATRLLPPMAQWKVLTERRQLSRNGALAFASKSLASSSVCREDSNPVLGLGKTDLIILLIGFRDGANHCQVAPKQSRIKSVTSISRHFGWRRRYSPSMRILISSEDIPSTVSRGATNSSGKIPLVKSAEASNSREAAALPIGSGRLPCSYSAASIRLGLRPPAFSAPRASTGLRNCPV